MKKNFIKRNNKKKVWKIERNRKCKEGKTGGKKGMKNAK